VRRGIARRGSVDARRQENHLARPAEVHAKVTGNMSSGRDVNAGKYRVCQVGGSPLTGTGACPSVNCGMKSHGPLFRESRFLFWLEESARPDLQRQCNRFPV
jgi:hypothetical protein